MLELRCTVCGSQLVDRIGPKGKFHGCSNWPACKGIMVNGSTIIEDIVKHYADDYLLELFDEILTEIHDRGIDLDASYKGEDYDIE